MTEKRVLLVLTSHDDLGGIRRTGYHAGEAAHPWREFANAGFAVDIASIAGGMPPQVGRDESDAAQNEFFADASIAAQLADTPKLADVDASRYDAVLFVGGHGTMWDFPDDAAVNAVGRAVYEQGGVVAAVCHGPAALVGITLGDGTPLVAGKRVAGFTNAEEAAVELTEVVPFLLAEELEAKGATHVPGPDFTEQVVVDERLVTGQNPQSATGVGREVVALLSA
ncbi:MULTISPECIES: type 1 glutamine amidotransferase domain-containing protein [unclassified Agromyces]|uniref:type 1 glutamine amidotransferase domain-containing protein n=1 Tax=unclassified Agromyces TaxID=2639701 RepID=UPI003014CD80